MQEVLSKAEQGMDSGWVGGASDCPVLPTGCQVTGQWSCSFPQAGAESTPCLTWRFSPKALEGKGPHPASSCLAEASASPATPRLTTTAAVVGAR